MVLFRSVETLPGYLMDTILAAQDGIFRSFGEERSEGPVYEATERVVANLDRWAEDEDFWESAATAQRQEPQPPEALRTQLQSDAFMAEELAVLEKAIGDRTLALSITFEVVDAGATGSHDPQKAREAVGRLAAAGRSIVEAPPPERQVWRALRYLRRGLRAAAGGLAVAADLVSPDVTGITKVVSIAGGLATIADALP
jgi:hypothetical protein